MLLDIDRLAIMYPQTSTVVSDAKGIVNYSNSAYVLSGTTASYIDCEGKCCCRCKACAGVGYWSSYTYTLPPNNFPLTTTDGNPLNGYTTVDMPSSVVKYGSQGGDGVCKWFKSLGWFTQTVYGTDIFGLDSYLTINADGSATLEVEMGYLTAGNTGLGGPSVFPTGYQYSVVYMCAAFDCRLGSVFAYGYVKYYNLTAAPPHPELDYTGTSVTVSPTGSATWNSCGQTSGGVFTGTRQSVGTSLPVVKNVDRCDHYIGRAEYVEGCNGWLCKGNCALGVEDCVPGVRCQECEKYEPDPDYEGQGMSGWVK